MVPLPSLSDSDWTELVKRLTLHADRKLVRLRWRGVPGKEGGRAPSGIEAGDLAAEAIEFVLDGRRAWNPAADPDLEQYLCSVIDSRVNHLANSIENKKTRRIEPVLPGTDDPGDPPEARVPDANPGPGDVVATREFCERVHALMEGELRNDPLALRFLECLDAEITKPAEIAELTGVPVEEIYNAQKRFRRASEKISRILAQRKQP